MTSPLFFRKSQFYSFKRDLFLHLQHIFVQEIRITLNEIPAAIYRIPDSYVYIIIIC